jgi:hypothetical protein
MAERVIFDRSLYLPEAVEAAALAYVEHARIEVTLAGDTVVAVISDAGEHDPPTLARSFSNHALYETIVRRRQAALEEVD